MIKSWPHYRPVSFFIFVGPPFVGVPRLAKESILCNLGALAARPEAWDPVKLLLYTCCAQVGISLVWWGQGATYTYMYI